jgi:hypothetical protein
VQTREPRHRCRVADGQYSIFSPHQQTQIIHITSNVIDVGLVQSSPDDRSEPTQQTSAFKRAYKAMNFKSVCRERRRHAIEKSLNTEVVARNGAPKKEMYLYFAHSLTQPINPATDSISRLSVLNNLPSRRRLKNGRMQYSLIEHHRCHGSKTPYVPTAPSRPQQVRPIRSRMT